MNSIEGNIVDIVAKKIYSGIIFFDDGRIQKIERTDKKYNHFIIPGFCDAHIHIESSMLCPTEFAFEAVKHGTISTVSDPHEIANVCGVPGIDFMISNSRATNFYFNYGAPSCVPATSFETSGAEINSEDIKNLLLRDDILYLSEMMNYPGVLNNDDEVMKKIKAAHDIKKPVDGHAPGLKGDDAIRYINSGISTDHECFTYDEALHKIKHGMKILIREGSSAKNFEALYHLIDEYPDMVMLCTDDTHPDDLLKGHINIIAKRAVAKGLDIMNILRCISLNPKLHYGLKYGLIQLYDNADFVVVNDLKNFEVHKTYVKGELVAQNNISFLPQIMIEPINNFLKYSIEENQIQYHTTLESIRVIEAIDGQLITREFHHSAIKDSNNQLKSDIENDILKIVVVNRYSKSKPAVAFIKNFGLKNGAIASSVAHDSHNIICVGVNDFLICKAINEVMKYGGGLAVINDTEVKVLPLPVAGLMTTKSATQVGKEYELLDIMTKEMGCKLKAPFMTLSFMALLVIPQLKISDKGLFDGSEFKFIPLEL
jgi:adenine deaminase